MSKLSHDEIVQNVLGNCESFEEYEVSIAAGLKTPEEVTEDILFLLSVIQSRSSNGKDIQ